MKITSFRGALYAVIVVASFAYTAGLSFTSVYYGRKASNIVHVEIPKDVAVSVDSNSAVRLFYGDNTVVTNAELFKKLSAGSPVTAYVMTTGDKDGIVYTMSRNDVTIASFTDINSFRNNANREIRYMKNGNFSIESAETPVWFDIGACAAAGFVVASLLALVFGRIEQLRASRARLQQRNEEMAH